MNMMITGLVLVTLGAILRYAVDSDWESFDVPIVGLILMCVGAVAFVVGVMQTFLLRDGRRNPAPQAPVPPQAYPYPPQPQAPAQPMPPTAPPAPPANPPKA